MRQCREGGDPGAAAKKIIIKGLPPESDNPHAVQQKRAVRRAHFSGAHAGTQSGAQGAAGCGAGGAVQG